MPFNDNRIFLHDMDLEDMWLIVVVMNLLKTKYGERVISRNSPVGWTPRSCDLTSLDYLLRGYVKSGLWQQASGD